MLKNVLLEIEYDGTNYFGWQIQNRRSGRQKTVQGEVEQALKKLFNEKIKLIYASRTDRRVHAKSQSANFTVKTKIPVNNIRLALNSFLPLDIRVKKANFVPLDFHARFNARSKIYRYVIYNKKSPCVFNRNYVWYLPDKLDLEKMRKAASKLLGRRDFSCFAKEAGKYDSCIRRIFSLSINKRPGYLLFDIEADGFLRNMVRNIVSFLVSVGRKEIILKDAARIISGKMDYKKKPAPGNGLYLLRVKYE